MQDESPLAEYYRDLLPGHPDPEKAVQERLLYASRAGVNAALGRAPAGMSMEVARPGDFDVVGPAERLAFLVDPESLIKDAARRKQGELMNALIGSQAGGGAPSTPKTRTSGKKGGLPTDESKTGAGDKAVAEANDRKQFQLVDEKKEQARERKMFATGSVTATGVVSYDSKASKSDSDDKREQKREEDDPMADLMGLHEEDRNRKKDDNIMNKGFGDQFGAGFGRYGESYGK